MDLHGPFLMLVGYYQELLETGRRVGLLAASLPPSRWPPDKYHQPHLAHNEPLYTHSCMKSFLCIPFTSKDTEIFLYTTFDNDDITRNGSA